MCVKKEHDEMNDKQIYDRIFQKIDRIEDKLDKMNVHMANIEHIVKDVENIDRRLVDTEKVTRSIMFIFKAVLFLGSMSGAIRLYLEQV